MTPDNITKILSDSTLAQLIEAVGKVELEGLAHMFYQRHFRAILRTFDIPHNPIWPTVWKTVSMSIHNSNVVSAIKVTATPPDAKTIFEVVDLIDLELRFSRGDDFIIEVTMAVNTMGMDEEQVKTLNAAISGLHGFVLHSQAPGVSRFTLDLARAYSASERDQDDLITARYWRGANSPVNGRFPDERFYRVNKHYSMAIRYSYIHKENVFVFLPDQPETLLEQLNDPDFYKEHKVRIAPLKAALGDIFEASEPIPFQQREAETVIQL